jgi:hypothetical protein
MNINELKQYHKQQQRKQYKIILLGAFILITMLSPIAIATYIDPGEISLTSASVILGGLLIFMPLIIWNFRSENRLRNVIIPDNSLEPNEPIHQDLANTLSIVPANMLEKYNSEILASNFFIGFLAVMAILGIAGVFSHESGLNILGYSGLILSVVILPLAFSTHRKSTAEKTLVNSAAREGLTLSNDILRFNIALLEGDYRFWLLKNKQAVGVLKWSEILFLSVEPSKLKSNNSSSPPYYKFVLKNPIARAGEQKNTIEEVFILRKPFYGRERDIINYIKSHANIPIEIYDELR